MICSDDSSCDDEADDDVAEITKVVKFDKADCSDYCGKFIMKMCFKS